MDASTELIPKGDFELERWRGRAIRAWLDSQKEKLGKCETLRKHLADDRAAIADLTSYNEFVFNRGSPLIGRFLVVKLIIYDISGNGSLREVDEYDWETCDTLEETKSRVESHIFADLRSDYTHECYVFDSNLRREQPYEEKRYIEWLDQETKS